MTQTRLEDKEQNLNQRVLSTGQIASRNMINKHKRMASNSSGTQASTIMLGGRNLNSMEAISGDVTARKRTDNIIARQVDIEDDNKKSKDDIQNPEVAYHN